MTSITVRNVPDEVHRALRVRAAQHGRSAEAEHRAILKAALAGPRRRTVAKVLASMPDVGLDTDFERVEATEPSPHVFD